MASTALKHTIVSLDDFEKDFGEVENFSSSHIYAWSQGTNFSINSKGMFKIDGSQITKHYRHPHHGILISENDKDTLTTIFSQTAENVSYYMVAVNANTVITKKHVPYGFYIIGVLEDDIFSYSNNMKEEHLTFLKSVKEDFGLEIMFSPNLTPQQFKEEGVAVFLTDQGPYTVMVPDSSVDRIYSLLKTTSPKGTIMSLAQIYVQMKNFTDESFVHFVLNHISEVKREKLSTYAYNYEMIELYQAKIIDFPSLRIFYEDSLDNNPILKARNMGEWKKFYGLVKKLGKGVLTDPKSFLMISRLISIENLENKIRIQL